MIYHNSCIEVPPFGTSQNHNGPHLNWWAHSLKQLKMVGLDLKLFTNVPNIDPSPF